MDPLETGAVSFEQFITLFNTVKAQERRKLIRKVKELFVWADKDKSGRLSKEEYGACVLRAGDKYLRSLDPPFDLDAVRPPPPPPLRADVSCGGDA